MILQHLSRELVTYDFTNINKYKSPTICQTFYIKVFRYDESNTMCGEIVLKLNKKEVVVESRKCTLATHAKASSTSHPPIRSRRLWKITVQITVQNSTTIKRNVLNIICCSSSGSIILSLTRLAEWKRTCSGVQVEGKLLITKVFKEKD